MHQLQPALSHPIPARQLPLPYPGHKAPNSKLQRKRWFNSKLKACIPANQQVGTYRAAVYTTKIMLALARVSKQQSQPFMVRVEINIAERRVLGGQAAPVVQHIYGCGSLTMSITAWYAGKHRLLSKFYTHCLGFFFCLLLSILHMFEMYVPFMLMNVHILNVFVSSCACLFFIVLLFRSKKKKKK